MCLEVKSSIRGISCSSRQAKVKPYQQVDVSPDGSCSADHDSKI